MVLVVFVVVFAVVVDGVVVVVVVDVAVVVAAVVVRMEVDWPRLRSKLETGNIPEKRMSIIIRRREPVMSE